MIGKLTSKASSSAFRQNSKLVYPPELSDEQLDNLVSDTKDYQLTHGSLLKLIQTDDESTVLAQPVGITLFPALFPKELFEEALSLRRIYNKLYTAVAEDPAWLYQALKTLIEADMLVGTLWGIYEEVAKEGYIQNISLGVFRSDYMLHQEGRGKLELKQVEFNTIACAGGLHGNRVSNMHRHLQRTGDYSLCKEDTSTPMITSSALPPNKTTSTIAAGIESAHKAFGPSKSSDAAKTCVLFIVQDNNFNIADERPIEYALWEAEIPTYHVLWGYQTLAYTSLTST